MAMEHGGGRGVPRSEINVTPLVDVCLVLLIIFMLVGPLLDQGGTDLLLPEGDNPAGMRDDHRQLVLAVKVGGTTCLNGRQVPEPALRSTLQEIRERSPSREVLLKADARLHYADVKRTLCLLAECGYRDVGLLARRREVTESSRF